MSALPYDVQISPPQAPLRLVAYARRPLPGAAARDELRVLRDWVAGAGHSLVSGVDDTDPGFGIADEGLAAVVKLIAAGSADGVVVCRLVRLGRNARLFQDSLDRIVQAGGVVLSCNDGFVIGAVDTDVDLSGSLATHPVLQAQAGV